MTQPDPTPTAEALLAHAAFLRRLAAGLLRDDAAADDVVQETWVRALERPPRHRKNLRGWLGRVARNVAFMRLRAERVRARHESRAGRRPLALPPHEAAARRELSRLLVDEVFRLGEPYRSTVVRRYFDGWSAREIAERGGIPLETVRTRLRRALDRLRDRLDERHDGGRKQWTALLPGLLAPVPAALARWIPAAAVLAVALAALLWGRAAGDANGTRRADPGRQGPLRTTSGTPGREDPHDGAPPARALALMGLVADADGRPLPGARVDARPDAAQVGPLDVFDLPGRLTDTPGAVATATTGADGRYRLALPAPGVYAVRADGGARGSAFVPALRLRATLDGLDFVVAATARLAGVARDDETGDPVAGVRVAVLRREDLFRPGPARMETRTDDRGRFELYPARDDGLVLVARHERYATTVIDTAGDPHVELRLTRGVPAPLAVVDPSGAPVPGARVLLGYGASLAAGRTDGDGRWRAGRIDALTKGVMGEESGLLVVHADGFAPVARYLEELRASKGALDLGPVTLERGGTIVGVVRERDSGAPVAGTVVSTLGGLGTDDAAHISVPRAVSGDDGRFELRDVPLRARALVAFHAAHVPDLSVLVSMEDEVAEPLFPDGRAELERDVFVVRPIRVEGVVADPDDRPIAGAIVAPGDDGAAAEVLTLLGVETTATSGADGSFVLALPEPGAPLVARHSAHAASKPVAAHDGVRLRLRAATVVRGRVVDENGAPVAGVRVFVGDAAAAVTGDDGAYVATRVPAGPCTIRAVTDDAREVQATVDAADATKAPDLVLATGLAVRGSVVGPDGLPVRDVTLVARPAGQDPRVPGRLRSARTGAGGTFVIPDLPEGDYLLTTVAPPRFARTHVRAVAGGPPVAIRLEPGEALAGRVVHGGQPVAGARVSARRDGFYLAQARTDVEGRFRLEALPRGAPFRLEVRHERFETLTVEDTCAPGPERDYALEEGRVLAGIVVDRADGRPVAGVALALHGTDPPQSRWATTDADGRFRAGGLTAARYRVDVAGTRSEWVEDTLGEFDTGAESLRLALTRGATIEGTLRDEQGQAVEGTVEATRADGHRRTGSADREGRFVVRGLGPGRYTLRVTGSGTLVASAVAEAGAREVRLVVRR